MRRATREQRLLLSELIMNGFGNTMHPVMLGGLQQLMQSMTWHKESLRLVNNAIKTHVYVQDHHMHMLQYGVDTC